MGLEILLWITVTLYSCTDARYRREKIAQPEPANNRWINKWKPPNKHVIRPISYPGDQRWLHVQFEETGAGGEWSQWSPWSDCQATCGNGFRTSNRWCSGNDCKGEGIRKASCFVKAHCPQNGGWGAWGSWRCSVTCGGGIGSRIRLCDSPPAFYGGICEGNSTSFWTEESCNAFTCPPTRTVSNDLFVNSNVVPEGAAIKVTHCGTKQLLDNLLWELKRDFRNAVQWLKNGDAWNEDKSRIVRSKMALEFKRVAANDTGFYSCELDLLGGGRKILKAFSLIVTSNKTNMEIDIGSPFELECNAGVLGSLYENARLSWFFNQTLFKSFNDTPAVLANAMKFPYATINMTGEWDCLTYELNIQDTTEKETKGLLEKLKDKVLGSKSEKNDDDDNEKKKKGSSVLSPLLKKVSTPSPLPQIIEGKKWITNRVRLRVNPPKSLVDLLRTPQFMGLCVAAALLALLIFISLLKTKASKMMGDAAADLGRLGKKNEAEHKTAPQKSSSYEQ